MTFGALTARAGFFAIQSSCMQKRKNDRRRSRFFVASLAPSVQIARNWRVCSTPRCFRYRYPLDSHQGRTRRFSRFSYLRIVSWLSL